MFLFLVELKDDSRFSLVRLAGLVSDTSDMADRGLDCDVTDDPLVSDTSDWTEVKDVADVVLGKWTIYTNKKGRGTFFKAE